MTGRVAYEVDADAGLLWGAGAGREQHTVVRVSLLGRHLVVAAHLGRGAELSEVLDEVEHEGVVVVDDEDADGRAAVGARAHRAGGGDVVGHRRHAAHPPPLPGCHGTAAPSPTVTWVESSRGPSHRETAAERRTMAAAATT